MEHTRIQEAQAYNTQSSSKTYSYFEDELTQQVINDLMNIKGYTKTQAQNLLYSGGLKIMTTQDPDIQNIVDVNYKALSGMMELSYLTTRLRHSVSA